MESQNNFDKGLHTDSHEQFQPQGTYRFAENYIRDISGALRNEPGTLARTSTPAGLEIIGSTVLGTRIIFFLCSQDNAQNEIGYFSTVTNSYTTVINSPVLNFNINNQVDAISRVNFNHESIAYYVDNLNPPRKIDIDHPPLPADYASSTKLIRDLKNPKIDFASLLETGGPLRCGTYQFGIRYVDASGNKTSFGQWTKEIPVTPFAQAGGRENYEGGDLSALASKSILLNISHLDDLFPFIEIGVRFYDASAQPVIKVADKLPINGTILTYTLTTNPDEAAADIDLNEASIEFPSIQSAKCIEQKDNRCFISNISELTELDLQEIANNITVEYIIDEQPHFDDNGSSSDRYLDYKLEKNTFEHRGYQRDEVYSLGVGVVYTNGTESFAYHIPARLGVGNLNILGQDLTAPGITERTWVAPTVDTATSGKLGSYVSYAEYPSNQGYPTDGPFIPGSPNLYLVRHHKMPSLEQQPHFGPGVIRVLGLKFKLNATARALLDALGDKIQALVFYREPRNDSSGGAITENSSIFSQGLTKHLFKTNNTYDTANGDWQDPQVYKKEPWYGNYYIQHFNTSIALVGSRKPYAFSPVSNPTGINTTPWSSFDNTKVEMDKLAYFAPEVYLDVNKIATFSPTVSGGEKMNLYGSKLKPVLKLSGTPQSVRQEVTHFDTSGTTIVVDKASLIWLGLDYNSHAPVLPDEKITGTAIIDPNKVQIVPEGQDSPPVDIGESTFYDSKATGKFLYLKLQVPIVKPNSGVVTWTVRFNSPASSSVTSTEPLSLGQDTKFLYNLISENTKQYGSIGNKPYNVVETFFDSDAEFTGTEFECYGGDTFICRWSFHDQDIYRCQGFKINGVLATSWVIPAARHTPDQDPGIKGFSFKAISYMFAEMRVNADFQHSNPGGQIYYPKYGDHTYLPVLTDKEYTKSNNTLYNKTYSHDNDVKLAFSKPADFVSVGKFETRTYYSPISIQGEKLDAFSQFQANNYDDLPKHTGEIIDSFVWENELYLHTPQALWQTYINPRVSQVDSIGQVFSGTGTLFAIPSKQIFTISGGYAGTTSQFAGTNTPFGRFFIDNQQGKVFLFNSNGFEEISNHGMFKEFLGKVTDTTDNPANGTGYTGSYDYQRKRWILTKAGEFSISYHPELKTWTSYHTHKATHQVSSGNKLFMFRKGTYVLHEMGMGPHGSYFGDAAVDSTITFVTNEASEGRAQAGIGETKVFDNMEFHTLAYNPSGTAQLMSTFYRIQCKNEYQDTGIYQVITDNTNYIDETFAPGQLLARMKKDHFQIALPRDNSGDERRLKSKWLLTTLKYDNSTDNALILNFIRTRSRLLYR